MNPTRILIVEDESLVADDIESRVLKLGYEVAAIADSAEGAVTKAMELHPDLVLMDIQLIGPGNGIQAADYIQRNQQIPVVFLTAHADPATLKRAGAVEPYGYVVKPFDERELHASIEMAFYRKQAEAKLLKMERWLATTLRSIGDAVIATDINGRISYVNPVAESVTGWVQSEALGQPFREVFHALYSDTHESIEDPTQRALSGGLTVSFAEDALLVTKDGAEVPIDDSAAPIRDDAGNITGAVVIFRDATERRRAADKIKELNAQLESRVRQRTVQLQAVNHSLECFCRSLAHDLRAPLRAVSSFATILREDCEGRLDDKARHILEVISTSCQRMDRMIEDYRRLAFLGTETLHRGPIDMESLAREVLENLRQQMPEHTFNCQIDPLPPAVGDRDLIRQVWVNLLSNAIKFSRQQERPFIQIGAHQQAGCPVYYVQDNGVGFDMKYANKLFAIFQRLHSAEQFEGTGVGLAIVHRILQSHGGTIAAEAQVNQGATFYFTLPQSQSQP